MGQHEMTGARLRNRWTCREINCEGQPCGQSFTIRHVRNIDIAEAAECAAAELDDRDDPDLDSWTIGDHSGQVRTVEIEELPGVWCRFSVRVTLKVEYAATKTKET